MKTPLITFLYLFFFLVPSLSAPSENINNFWNKINIFKNHQHEIKGLEKLTKEYTCQKKFDKALSVAKQGLSLSEKENSKEYIIKFCSKIGNIYCCHKNLWDSSLIYFNKSLNVAKQINNKQYLANTYLSIAIVKIYQYKAKEALSYCNLALANYREIEDQIGIIDVYTNLSLIYMQLGEFNAAKNYALKSIHTIQEEKSDTIPYGNYINLAYIYYSTGKYDSSLYYSNLVLKYGEGKKLETSFTYTYFLVGRIYSVYGNYSKAIEYHIKALEIYEELGFKRGIITGNSELGDIFEMKNEYKNAIKYYLKCLEIAKKIGCKSDIAITYSHLGYNYYKLKEYEIAGQYLSDGLLLAEKINMPDKIASIKNYLGLIYVEKKDYKEALKSHLQSLDIYTKLDIKSGIAETYYYLGNYYKKIGVNKKAISYLNKSLKINEELKNLAETGKVLLSISENYSQLFQYKQAYEYFRKYKILNDSLNNENQTKRIAQLEMQYEFDQKQKEQKFIQQQKEDILHAKIKNQKLLTFTATASTFLLFILSILGFRNYKLKQKNIRKGIELQRVEVEKKHEVDQMKLHFFANASHDIRTPLTLIKGPLNELMENKEMPRYMKRNLELIYRNTNLLHRFMDQILDFQKLDSNVMGLTLTQHNIILFTREIIESFSYLIENKKCKLDFLPENSELIMWFDTEKVEKILCNLLTNAIKFTPKYKTIKVNISDDTDWVYISVKDSGVGIPPDHLNLIFERYHQVEKTKAFYNGGSGIGLAHTKELVKLHKGKITVNSSETEGSEFTVMLPRNKEAYNEKEVDFLTEENKDNNIYLNLNISKEVMRYEKDFEIDEALEKTDIEKKTSVLIVEDDYDMQQYIVNCLQPHFTIYQAYNGEEGFDTALKNNPDVIVSDIMMKNMDGIELCNKIKTEFQVCHIPVILLTALDTIENKIIGFKTGADDYITKPFDEKLLQARLLNIIESRRVLREVFTKNIILEPRKITINSLDEEFLKEAIRIIEENMSDSDFNVDILCSKMHVSRSVFYRKIKALTNLSSNDFIKSIRLKCAAQLLKENSLTITQIAYETGFTSLKYFRKCFRGYYSKSPSEYARQIFS